MMFFKKRTLVFLVFSLFLQQARAEQDQAALLDERAAKAEMLEHLAAYEGVLRAMLSEGNSPAHDERFPTLRQHALREITAALLAATRVKGRDASPAREKRWAQKSSELWSVFLGTGATALNVAGTVALVGMSELYSLAEMKGWAVTMGTGAAVTTFFAFKAFQLSSEFWRALLGWPQKDGLTPLLLKRLSRISGRLETWSRKKPGYETTFAFHAQLLERIRVLQRRMDKQKPVLESRCSLILKEFGSEGA